MGGSHTTYEVQHTALRAQRRGPILREPDGLPGTGPTSLSQVPAPSARESRLTSRFSCLVWPLLPLSVHCCRPATFFSPTSPVIPFPTINHAPTPAQRPDTSTPRDEIQPAGGDSLLPLCTTGIEERPACRWGMTSPRLAGVLSPFRGVRDPSHRIASAFSPPPHRLLGPKRCAVRLMAFAESSTTKTPLHLPRLLHPDARDRSDQRGIIDRS